jgi:adenylate cyclase
MTEGRTQCRLAAILAADVVGYSRLMAADEPGTLATLKARRREVLMPLVAQHQGRVFKVAGDGVLVEFGSAVNAVECAVELQQAMASANRGVPPDRQVILRVGINLGEVMVEGNDFYGDGVNVATRLEQLAEAGGVCISDVVYQNVKSKLDLRFESLGAKALKNIPGETQVYWVHPHAPAVSEPVPHGDKPKLPDKPSIAVLPFTNMSSVHDQDFFADGMTEDIITALSRIAELFVISRNSSFVYKGRAVRPEDVAQELGVRFLLEGSVRVAGNRVRVTAQLIDGRSGGHVWAETFDGGLDDVFAVQDEITRRIALAMQVKLTYGESARLWEGQTKSLRAWEKMALGRGLMLRFNAIDNREARRVFKEALEIDPNYTGAMVLLAHTYWWEARFDTSADKEHCLELAEQQIDRALSIDQDLGIAFMMRGGVAFLRDQHDEAIRLCQKAVDLTPSDAWVAGFLGIVCIFGGESERAVAALKTAMRLSPHHPNWYSYQFTLANLWAGDLAAAEAAALRYFQLEPEDPFAFTNLATVYAFQQREAEAAATISELKKKFPVFGTRDIVLAKRYKEREKLDRILDVLNRAGLTN